MTSGSNNFNHFAENQLTKFSARDTEDFSDAADEWENGEMVPQCGSLLRHARGSSDSPYGLWVLSLFPVKETRSS